jgi:hypothetical protein
MYGVIWASDLSEFKTTKDFMVLLPKAGDQVIHVTSKPVIDNFIIIPLIFIYEFGYSFPLPGFVRGVFFYFNISLA